MLLSTTSGCSGSGMQQDVAWKLDFGGHCGNTASQSLVAVAEAKRSAISFVVMIIDA